jgi:hypothetical protein
MASDTLPTLPVPLEGLVNYVAKHPETPMVDLMEPFRKYEGHLRQAFAQDPGSELLKDPHVNVLPLFTEDTPNIKIRARNLASESEEEQSKYIMPLSKEVRRPHNSPAIVQSLKDFQRNFNVFSESSLIELDWYEPWHLSCKPPTRPLNFLPQEQCSCGRILCCQQSPSSPR